MKNLFLIIMLFILLPLSGCATLPKDAFKLSATSLEERQLQTRKFNTDNELALISSGLSVLQDMGYTLNATEKDLGLITASKKVDAIDGGQVALAVLAALAGSRASIDKEQIIKVTYATHKSREKGYYLSRITFQRIVWNTDGNITKAESIKDTKLYNGFFDKLSKSVFLEAHKI